MINYSSNKNNGNTDENQKLNKILNIDKKKLSLKNINNNYQHYYNTIYNKTNNEEKDDNIIEKDISNILTFEKPNYIQNRINYHIPLLNLENNKNNNEPFLENNNYAENINNNYNESSQIKYNVFDNIDINNGYNNILNNDLNKNENFLRNKQNLNNIYNNNDINKNDDDYLEEKKQKDIIRNIISLILIDKNKLIELQKYFGNEIGEKLLKGDINQENLIRIVGILKNYQNNTKSNKNDKNLFRGSKNNYKSFYYKRYNDNILHY